MPKEERKKAVGIWVNQTTTGTEHPHGTTKGVRRPGPENYQERWMNKLQQSCAHIYKSGRPGAAPQQPVVTQQPQPTTMNGIYMLPPDVQRTPLEDNPDKRVKGGSKSAGWLSLDSQKGGGTPLPIGQTRGFGGPTPPPRDDWSEVRSQGRDGKADTNQPITTKPRELEPYEQQGDVRPHRGEKELSSGV